MLTKKQQQSIVQKLMPYKPAQIGIFGSYARGKEGEESDLDLLVSLKERINLFELLDLEEEINAMLGVEVDLVTDKSINKYMEPYIRKDIIYIFDD